MEHLTLAEQERRRERNRRAAKRSRARGASKLQGLAEDNRELHTKLDELLRLARDLRDFFLLPALEK